MQLYNNDGSIARSFPRLRQYRQRTTAAGSGVWAFIEF
jgi:hypothetical protein